MTPLSEDERLRRWRLVLGAAEKSDGTNCALTGDDLRLDAALSALYDGQGFGNEGRGQRRPAWAHPPQT